jgi:putative transposase
MGQPDLFADRKHQTKVRVYEEWLRRPAGIPLLRAVKRIAETFGISQSTARRYIREIGENGYQPALKPRQGRKVYAWDPEAVDFLKTFYLATQGEAGTCTRRNAYNKTVEAARLKGWKVGSEQSAYVHLRDIHSMLLAYASGGRRALDNIFYIARDLSGLAPFQVIVGDQHTFKYTVIHQGKEAKPQCYCWLDMRTRLVYGIAFEPDGAYTHRTVARALKMGIIRFGKFNSTYNDNGTPEKSGKIDRLVGALQTYGMDFKDTADLYRTGEGEYAVEDAGGSVVATVDSLREWRRQNRRMFAQVRNAKAKPIERFFRTLDTLLADMILPGYSPPFPGSAAEGEEAARRLAYQRDRGYLLGSEEFFEKVRDAVVRYENRDHAGLGHPPLEELRRAREQEGWEPARIDENDIRHIFLEQQRCMVRGNRVRIAGINYTGPKITRETLKENRNDLAGLDGQRVPVYYDPDDPLAGAWATDPRSGASVYLAPEEKIDPFNAEALGEKLAEKRGSIKAVAGAYRETAAAAGKVLASPRYKPLIEAEQAARKAAAGETAKERAAAAMSEEDFEAAVASRLAGERREKEGRRPVYATPMKRYGAVIDTILRGGDPSDEDKAYKADYESRMGPEEKAKWQVYINFNSPAPGAKE